MTELPLLENDFYIPYNSKGLELLSVCLSADESRIKSAISPFSLSFPILVDQSGETVGSYKVASIPLNLVVDKKGVIQYRKAGYDPNGIRSIVEKLL